MAYEIKERSLGEILDGAFQIYRNHFGVFVGVALCVVVPTALAVSLVTWLVTGSAAPVELDTVAPPAPGTQPNFDPIMRSGLATLLALPVQLLGAMVQDAVLTLAVADAYLGRSISFGGAFKRSTPALAALFGASALKSLGIGLGLVCCFIPGVVLMLRWALSSQAIMIEGKPVLESLARSRELTKGNYGRLVLLMVLMTVIGMGLHLGLRTVIPDSVEHVAVLGQLLPLLPQVLVAPVTSAALTLAYFDLRVRKEGFDLERLALGGADGPVASHGA